MVNNGPQPISYNLTAELDKGTMEDLDRADGGTGDVSDIPDPGDNASAITDDSNPIYKTLTVTPTEGIIEPFAHLPVNFNFAPNYSTKKSGFNANAAGPESQVSRNFAVKVTVDGEGIKTDNVLELTCTGKAVRPNIKLSQQILRFGECPVYERRDILLTIQNTSELPLPYKFDKLPNFQARPSKGILEPTQTQSCVVSYAPGQMGERKSIMNLTVAGGLAKYPIRCMGQATAPAKGAKKTLTGGPNAQPGDFKPTFNFVKSEKADDKKARNASNKWVRAQPWKEVDLLGSSAWDESKATLSALVDGSAQKETFSMQKLAENAEHKKKYNNFLSAAREERAKKATQKKEAKFQAKFGGTGKYEPNHPNLGMDRELDEPIPALPVATEGLWLQRPLDGSAPTGGGGRMPVDENRLIHKKFKPAPTTQAEVRDCEAELSSQELLGVVASSKIIDFGEVVINSTTAKNFAVSNDLPRCVLVALGKLDTELELSGPASQVVPSGGTAGFDIKFSSSHEGKFKKSVQWVVNSKHTFKFTILAEVVPVSILLTTDRVQMSFPDQCLDASVTEIITMENPGNAPAEFLWTSRRAFTVKPERGMIDAFSTADVEITWTPSPAYKNAEVLNLHVPGGEDVELPVEGQLAEARCKFAEKELDCGTVAVGIESTHTVKLKNVGKSPAIVSVDNFPEGYGISCKPDRARIAIGDVLEFTLTIKPPMPRRYEDVAMGLSVRGGKMLRMPISCEAVVPKIAFEQTTFDFDKVVIGNRIRMSVTLKNEGNIPASLQVDLSKYPEFTLHEPKQATIQSDIGGFMDAPTQVHTLNSLDPVYNGRGDDDEVAHKWKIIVDASSTFELDFWYKPTSVTNHDFMFPLMFQGIPHDASMKRQVNSIGVKPRLIMSSTCADFEDKVVQRDPGRRIPYTTELTFKNDSDKGISWLLDDTTLRPVSSGVGGNITSAAIWFVSPKRGNLTPGEVVTVRATFSPQEDADYEAEFPLYLEDQEDKSRPYLNLTLCGCGVYPRVTFSVEEVMLPVVPLNVVSRAKFMVINDGYDTLKISHKLPLNCQAPLEVEFPKGKSIGLGVDAIPVIVSYSSDKPISLNTKLDFFDTDGSCYSINLCGTSDNSVFTNYGFLNKYHDQYKYFTMDGSPVVLYDRKQVLEMQKLENKRKEADKFRKRKQTEIEMKELAESQNNPKKGKKEKEKAAAAKAEKTKKMPKPPPPLTTGQLLDQTEADEKAGIDVEQEDYKMADNDIEVVKKWLNANVMVAPIVNFPGDFLDTNGKAGIDAIEAMCGKKVPGKVKKLTSVKADQWSQLYGQYRDLLLFMKQHGGLLAGVRPENLLQRNFFIAAREDEATNGPVRVTAAQLKARKSAWESGHSTINKEAWASLMFQAIRVFVLGRVTPKGLSQLPGVLMPATSKGKGGGAKGIDSELEGSNLYTLGESCLMKWVGYHVKATLTNSILKKRIINFESDFADGSVLCHLLASHLPHLNKEGGELFGFTPCNESQVLEKEDVRKSNCEKALNVLKVCRMDFGATLEGLMNPSARQMVMWVLHLYQALPQLIPKTSIDFNCTLGATMKKSIALTNPSSRPISYMVTLEGCADFSMETSQITLDPKSVSQFIVSLTPKFSKLQEARLTFWTQKDGGPLASNLVFLLKSNVKELKAVNTYKMDAKCYEMTTLDVIVKNPYDKACTFYAEFKQNLESQFHGVPGVNFPLPEQIFGHTLKQRARRRVGTAGSSTRGGHDNKEKEEAEAAEQLLVDKKECLKILGEPFYVPKTTKIKLGPGEETTLQVQVVAFVPGVYKGYLILLDTNVGEFCYEVSANVGLPPPSADMSFDVNVDEDNAESEKWLKLPVRNGQIERAATILLDRMDSKARTRCRSVLMSFLAPASSVETGGMVRYRCMIDSPYFQGSPDVIMKGNEFTAEAAGGSKAGTPSTGRRGGGGGAGIGKTATLEDAVEGQKPVSNVVGLSFYPKESGAYPCTVMVLPFSGEPDLRIYTISSSVTTPPKETSLDFKAPARQVVTQEIPISNNGAEDWTLSCSIGGSKCFSGPTSFKVAGNTTENYPLTFKPSWVCKEEGTLVMKNAKIGNNFIFTLHGVSEEPLAEGNVTIRCKAREKIEETIEFPNLGAKIWSVETDLPYVTGASTFTSGSGGYTVSVHPQTGGNFNGQITFTDEKSGQYAWFTVDMIVVAPAAEAKITMRSECRKATCATIALANPTDEPIVFDVRLDGDGLLGDKQFVLAPSTKSSYELYYSPLLAQKHEGTVAFTNELAGEFWYELELAATSAPSVTLEQMSCPVGGNTKTRVFIQNPTGKEVKMGSNVNNKRNFSVVPGGIKLPPYGEGWFDVVYTPSSLGEVESSRIDITHPELGAYIYMVSGVGEMPGVMDEDHSPICVVHDQTTYPFKFRNPFNAALVVDLVLETDEDMKVNNDPGSPQDSFDSRSQGGGFAGQEIFKLLPKNTREIVMAPYTSIQVPISFAPDNIEEKGARLIVRGELGTKKDLVWIYNIRGLAEAPIGKGILLNCPAKGNLKHNVEVPLYGLVEDGFQEGGEEFEFAIEYPNCTEMQLHYLKEWIYVVGSRLKLVKVDGKLKFQFLFNPLRPFTAGCELVVVRKSSGGRWKFPIRTDVTDAEPEDEPILIEAALKTVKKVLFRMNNRTQEPAKFQAFFTVDSANTLHVEPSSGVLEPYGTDGTEFVLSYAPQEYGVYEKGKLIIQTDECQWIYNVLTKHPDYNAPDNVDSKLDNKLDPYLAQSLGTSKIAKKNIIAENMKSKNLLKGRERNEKAKKMQAIVQLPEVEK